MRKVNLNMKRNIVASLQLQMIEFQPPKTHLSSKTTDKLTRKLTYKTTSPKSKFDWPSQSLDQCVICSIQGIVSGREYPCL